MVTFLDSCVLSKLTGQNVRVPGDMGIEEALARAPTLQGLEAGDTLMGTDHIWRGACPDCHEQRLAGNAWAVFFFNRKWCQGGFN